MVPRTKPDPFRIWVLLMIVAAWISAIAAVMVHLQDVSISEPGLIWNQDGWGELIGFGTAYLVLMLGAFTLIAPALIMRLRSARAHGGLRSALYLTAAIATGITTAAIWIFDFALALVAVLMRPAPECYYGVPGTDDPGGCAFLHAHPFPQIIFMLGMAAAIITLWRIPSSVREKINGSSLEPQTPRPM
jgi:hypothetical protein